MAQNNMPRRGVVASAPRLGASTLSHFFYFRLFSLFFFAPAPNSLRVHEITNHVCKYLINTNNHTIKVITKDPL